MAGRFFYFVISFILMACGGGGGSGEEQPNLSENEKGQPLIITASASEGGKIAPETKQLNRPESINFQLSADLGFELDSISGCNGSLKNNIYTTPTLTKNCQVSAFFKPISLDVRLLVEGEGTLLSDHSKVAYGQTLTVRPEPQDGYLLSHIAGCNGQLESGLYQTPPITEQCSIHAQFDPIKTEFSGNDSNIDVQVSVKGGYFGISSESKGLQVPGVEQPLPDLEGSVFPFDILNIVLKGTTKGEAANVIITYPSPLPENFDYYKYGPASEGAEPSWYSLPDTSYKISDDRRSLQLNLVDGELGDSDWVANGIIRDPGGPVVQGIVVDTHSNEGGDIFPKRKVVGLQQQEIFTITPDSGYVIEDVFGCDGVLDGTQYTTGQILASCTITAIFSEVSQGFIVSSIAGDGGRISPASQVVMEGELATLTVEPALGFAIQNVSGCGGQLSGNTYTTSPITSDCAVNTVFVEEDNRFTVNGTAGDGGRILPASQAVLEGETATFTVEPVSGFVVQSVSGCDGQLSGSTYTTSPITSDCSVNAVFVEFVEEGNRFTVRGAAGDGGRILPTSQVVLEGETATFTVEPALGFTIKSVSGCGGRLLESSYITAPADKDCSISAQFQPVIRKLIFNQSKLNESVLD